MDSDGNDHDLERLRQHIQESLNGDLGDEAQENMIISVFEGQLKHQMGQMTLWAGNGVGSIGKSSDTLIWS